MSEPSHKLQVGDLVLYKDCECKTTKIGQIYLINKHELVFVRSLDRDECVAIKKLSDIQYVSSEEIGRFLMI